MNKDNIDSKLLIYVLTSSILKVSPMYFTQDALDALASAEKELIQGLKTLKICLIFWTIYMKIDTSLSVKMKSFRMVTTKVTKKVLRMVELKSNLLKILYLFLFCFLISIPSSLSVPVKGRESSGIVLLNVPEGFGHLYLEEQQKELRCIKAALWYESRSEPEEGIRAVMSVIYNRKKHKNYPNTFCGVILQPMQFSAFNSDKGLATRGLKPVREFDKKAHAVVAYIANEAVLGRFKPILEPSVLWYTKHGVQRQWMKRLKIHLEIGGHKFYGG